MISVSTFYSEFYVCGIKLYSTYCALSFSINSESEAVKHAYLKLATDRSAGVYFSNVPENIKSKPEKEEEV